MKIEIIDVNQNNFEKHSFFCIKNIKSDGYKAKKEWFTKKNNSSIRIKIAYDDNNEELGFVEYTTGEQAWRPVNADNYLFIHCIVVKSKKNRSQNIASELVLSVENEAKNQNKFGVCVMTSKGSWIADKRIFENNNYQKTDELGRFELYAKKNSDDFPFPVLINWKKQQNKYQGWNLIYSNQCPWHAKPVVELKEVAKKYNIELKITEITTPQQAKNAPSGFGTFSLLFDNILLEDHYLSKTRFENILKKELKI